MDPLTLGFPYSYSWFRKYCYNQRSRSDPENVLCILGPWRGTPSVDYLMRRLLRLRPYAHCINEDEQCSKCPGYIKSKEMITYCLNVHESRVRQSAHEKLNEDGTRNNSYDGHRYGTNVTTADMSPQGTISVEAARRGGGGGAA
jgi:hypothetical protein